ncbi:hypothetical protein JXO59_08595 [candidate division KSB1 bacterium]|nr:hypothetical protein [candidate division KSB1 bacterium]
MFNCGLLQLFALCLVLNSQTLFSHIILTGTVTDNGAEYLGNGAEPVAEALVTITNQADTECTFIDYTDARGHYSIEISQTVVDDSPIGRTNCFRLQQNYPNPSLPL